MAWPDWDGLAVQSPRSIDTRMKIVRVTLSQFAMLGFEGGRTRGIAQIPDVPHSLVIHHFKTPTWKEPRKGVWRSVCRPHGCDAIRRRQSGFWTAVLAASAPGVNASSRTVRR